MSPSMRAAVFGARVREAGMATAGVLVIVLVGTAAFWRRAAPDWPTATARQQAFAETLVETGTIGAQRLMLYASTIPGTQAKILDLAPEGQTVKAGDVLVRFDASGFEQARDLERAALRQADAELVRAREELRLESLRAQGDLDAAREQIGHAERGLANQLEGRGRVELAEAEAAANEAARELDRARSPMKTSSRC